MTIIAQLFDLAVRHHQSGNAHEAAALLLQILQAEPVHAPAYHLLGFIAHEAGHYEAAVTQFRYALSLNPDDAVCHFNLSNTLMSLGRAAEAIGSYREAIRINPNHAQARNNLGNAYQSLGQLSEAADCYRQALRLDPEYADASYNLANALCDQGQLAEAVPLYRQALANNAQSVGAHNNLGNVLLIQGRLDEAAACYARALSLESEHSNTRWNQACLRLLRGDLPAAWAEFDRWKPAGFVPRHARQPSWGGSPLDGKTILFYPDQGLGDTIQFIRYASLVQARGGTVLLECHVKLARLFTGVTGIDQVISAAEPRPTFDVQAALSSLPHIFATTLTTIPTTIPYLHADAALMEYWRQELAPLGGFKVGIAWQGNPSHQWDRYRSVPLSHFEALARVEGVKLVSLQKGPGTEQLHKTTARIINPADATGRFAILDLEDRLDKTDTFVDTAAILRNLDLVVTVDTAVAHLAGALGVPVWVALAVTPDWRWLLERTDSPWYPTMRLFRQKRFGDWGEVFERMAAEIVRLK